MPGHAVKSGTWLLGLFYFSAPALHAGTDPSVPGPDAMDACALLRRSEIARVIGAPVGAPAREDAGVQSNGSYSSTCVWVIETPAPKATDATAPLGGRSFVILNVMQWPRGSHLAHTFLDSFREAAKSGDIPNKTTPRNFGDEALWWGDGLAVRADDDVSFGISVFFPGARLNHRGILEERLAPHILRRLQKRAGEMKQEHE